MSGTQIFGFQIEYGPIADTKVASSGSPNLNAGNTTLSQDITQLASSATNALPITGGTMTGSLILNANPVTGLGAATKQYVDASAVLPAYYFAGFIPTYTNTTEITLSNGTC